MTRMMSNGVGGRDARGQSMCAGCTGRKGIATDRECHRAVGREILQALRSIWFGVMDTDNQNNSRYRSGSPSISRINRCPRYNLQQ